MLTLNTKFAGFMLNGLINYDINVLFIKNTKDLQGNFLAGLHNNGKQFSFIMLMIKDFIIKDHFLNMLLEGVFLVAFIYCILYILAKLINKVKLPSKEDEGYRDEFVEFYEITLTGSKLTINSTEVNIKEEGTFLYTLTLKESNNLITILSSDTYGNTTSY